MSGLSLVVPQNRNVLWDCKTSTQPPSKVLRKARLRSLFWSSKMASWKVKEVDFYSWFFASFSWYVVFKHSRCNYILLNSQILQWFSLPKFLGKLNSIEHLANLFVFPYKESVFATSFFIQWLDKYPILCFPYDTNIRSSCGNTEANTNLNTTMCAIWDSSTFYLVEYFGLLWKVTS